MAAVDVGAHDLGLPTHLGVAHAAQPALIAATIVVDHDARAGWRLLLGHTGAALHDDSARFVAADHGSVETGFAVQIEIAAANTGGAHLNDDFTRTRLRIWEFLECGLSITREHKSVHHLYRLRQPAPRMWTPVGSNQLAGA